MKINRQLLEDIIKEALSNSAREAEVFALNSRTLNIEVKSQDIENIDISESTGYAIRVIKNHRLGFAYSTEPERYKEVVREAITTSKFTSEDLNITIATPSTFPEVNVFDEDISSIEQNRAIELVMSTEQAALEYDNRIKRIRKAGGSFTESEILIANSKGLSGSFKATSCTAHITLAAEESGEAQMGWGYDGSRRLSDIDFRRVGREAAERAISLLGAKRAKTCKTYVLLDTSVAAEFLSVLSSSFSADNVQKGKSLLIGKQGKKILSERINIIDNALVDYHLGSRPFDAEGVPSRQNTLVSSGVLQGYLHNLYTAKKASTLSTASAVRGGVFSPPSVGISNLYIQPSDDRFSNTYDELLKQMPGGVVVTEAMGVHTANPITGEFSFGITGLWVEKGEIKYPIKEAAISGNMLDIFSRIVATGDEIRFYGKIGTPHLLIEGVDISG